MLGSLGEVLFPLSLQATKAWTEGWAAHLFQPHHSSEVAETLCPFGVEPHNLSAVRC